MIDMIENISFNQQVCTSDLIRALTLIEIFFVPVVIMCLLMAHIILLPLRLCCNKIRIFRNKAPLPSEP